LANSRRNTSERISASLPLFCNFESRIHALKFYLQVILEPQQVFVFLLAIAYLFCPAVNLKRDQDAKNKDD